MSLAETLKQLRLDAQLTQEDLAGRLFVTRQAVSRWESGENSPSLDTLKLIAQTFDASPYELLGLPEPDDAELDLAPRIQAIAANERSHGKEARTRYGDDVIDAANERIIGLSEEEWESVQVLEQEILAKLAEAFDGGAGNARGACAMDVCYMHEQWLRLHWPKGIYTAEAHRGLAQGYLADDRFIAYYDNAVAPGATRFLVCALDYYCSNRINR